MNQAEQCARIAKELKNHNINIWCYTGFTYDFLTQKQVYRDFLQYIDILVDGVFIEELKSYELQFRGSSNQRLIDVQKSLQENKVVLWEGYNV
jgi:anaerobic ribonucleoside-triphosphate reductase activating protein